MGVFQYKKILGISVQNTLCNLQLKTQVLKYQMSKTVNYCKMWFFFPAKSIHISDCVT